ncbi:MAG: HEAT repeat domain-containing protein [Phycisphaerae bacterium]|nr:HEAT repeat domain-containing protein [Phycisphaerae bacterium]
MTVNLPVLEILQGSENPSADEALVEGLARAEASCHESFVDVLLARRSKKGLSGLIAHFHHMAPKLQSRILEHSETLFGALRGCIKSRDLQTRQNALEMVRRTGSYRLAYLLSLALHDSSANVRQRAAEVLRELADRYFRQEKITLEVLATGPFSGAEQASVQAFSLARLAEERTFLISAIAEAVNDYDVHRRPEVAETVVWFARHLNETLWRAIANRLSNCGRAVVQLIETRSDPRMVPFIYQALGHRDLRPVVARIISYEANDEFMTEFVRWAFLTSDPRVRRGIASIRSLNWLARRGRAIMDLPEGLQSRAVDLILASTMAIERKVAVCRDLLLSGQRVAQRAGLWGLIAIEDPMSTQLIRTVVQWEDQDLSAVAVREMMRRCPEDLPSLLAEQLASDSPSLRQLASEQVTGYGFDQYWQSFEMLSEEDRRRLGKALLMMGRDFVSQVRNKLAGSRAHDRLRAVQIVAALDLQGQLDEEVYRIAYDPDSYVRSSVMSLLGRLPGPTSERILLNGLNDTDERAQANAIEALERLRASDRFNQIRQHLSSDDNRVRANAVKALLSFQSPEAAAILIEMLEHRRAEQRLSALWVVEVLKLMSVSGRVLKLAKYDPDPNVRRRALQAVAVMNNSLRGSGVGGRQAPAAASGTRVTEEAAS